MEKSTFVRIEFLRVQTFLFQSPKMRDMIGFNTLLGETIRNTLPDLATYKGPMPITCKELKITPPTADSNDPLHHAKEKYQDDPAALYEKGILTRDGGHFRVVFENENKAEEFAKEASKRLNEKLPGLRYNILTGTLEDEERGTTFQESNPSDVMYIPQFMPCTFLGNEPAIEFKRKNSEYKYFCKKVEIARDAGERFRNGEAKDIIGLLKDSMSTGNEKEPNDFEDMCGKDDLAVIVADGNDMGGRFHSWMNKVANDLDSISREAHGEIFWHTMRVATRKALVSAIKKTFYNEVNKPKPYQVLMLGGDDLLMVCAARYAFRFVTEYARALESEELYGNLGNTDNEIKPLTIGAGITITSPKLPFHRLHSLAEELADSAKELYRNSTDKISTVDWIVCSSSWSDDPITVRKRDMLKRYEVNGSEETLFLTGKPYPVLKTDGETNPTSLEGLLEAGKVLLKEDGDEKGKKAARTQIRSMADMTFKGRRTADLYFQRLPHSTSKDLKEAGVKSTWEEIEGGNWLTRLNDLAEIYEIMRKTSTKVEEN